MYCNNELYIQYLDLYKSVSIYIVYILPNQGLSWYSNRREISHFVDTQMFVYDKHLLANVQNTNVPEYISIFRYKIRLLIA